MFNVNNMMQMMSEFNRFKNQYNGDPRLAVQNLLNTGRMSQAQFNQLQSMANELQKVFRNP